MKRIDKELEQNLDEKVQRKVGARGRKKDKGKTRKMRLWSLGKTK